MATPGQSFEQLTVFGRFLRQKNGIANMLMAGLCVRARPPPPISRARPDSRRHPPRVESTRADTPPRFSAGDADRFFRIPFSPTSRSCCALSARLLQQRKEHDERTAAMESAFATERAELNAEIDRLRGRGWFGRGRSRGGAGRPTKGDGADKGGEGVGAPPAREKRNAAAGKVMV